ncbi:MAG: hypothetical protein DMG62_11330 [Acidobacteria bacterium]|nr:MAG: hypothetical protein DMG62_11330 [Acidobacteriota bacterium]
MEIQEQFSHRKVLRLPQKWSGSALKCASKPQKCAVWGFEIANFSVGKDVSTCTIDAPDGRKFTDNQ